MLDIDSADRMAEEYKKLQKEYKGETSEKTKEVKLQHPQVYEPPIGLIIYIAVMLIGTVFVDRWLIWIAATLIYFGRKR